MIKMEHGIHDFKQKNKNSFFKKREKETAYRTNEESYVLDRTRGGN